MATVGGAHSSRPINRGAFSGACPGLALTIYETLRTKKKLTVDQHRAIHETIGCYLAVKANAGTVGHAPEGCERLSEFVNVWVGESEWNRLGPHGAIGCASSLVYMNPRVLLHMFELLQREKWDELQRWSDLVGRLFNEGLAPFAEKGFTDTADDHVTGVVAGFLKMSVRSRGPYTSASDKDVGQLRAWMQANTPELLEL